MATSHRILHRDWRVLEAIFRHPLPGNLAWSDALHLIERLGTAHREANGRILLVIGEHKHVFHQPHAKELTHEDLVQLRKFLESAGVTPTSVDRVEETPAEESAALDMVVTVDHHEARLFAIHGSSATATRLQPYDPHHFLHHLTHREDRELRGQREPEEPGYYEQIAAALAPARRIVLLGHGSGHSNAAARLEELLRAKHPDIARRVIATRAVDLSAMTEAQLLAAASQSLP
jgi:hypothetical protein